MDEMRAADDVEYFSADDRAGLESMRRSLDARQSRQCPACGSDLVEEHSEGVRADICRSCGGAWLDREALETLSKGAATAALGYFRGRAGE